MNSGDSIDDGRSGGSSPYSDDMPDLFDFGEDEESDNDGQDDNAGAMNTSLTEEEMDLIFPDDDKMKFLAMEEELLEAEDAWLNINMDKEPEKIIAELSKRQSQARGYMMRLKKKRFIELGGKQKTRSLLMRYGISHAKVVSEKAMALFECPETNPRSVANALLARLRGATSNDQQAATEDEIGASKRFQELKVAFRKWFDDQQDDELSRKFDQKFEAEAAKEEAAKKAEAAAANSPTGSELISPTDPGLISPAPESDPGSPPKGAPTKGGRVKGTNEEYFVRGMTRFFAPEALIVPVAVSKAKNDEFGPREANGGTDPLVAGNKKKSPQNSPPRDGARPPVVRDFFDMGPLGISIGFHALYTAIDVNEQGWILFSDLMHFLLEVTMLRQGESGAERKEFEFMYSAHSVHFTDISDAKFVKARDFLIVCAADVVFYLNEPHIPYRGMIKTPVDPHTLMPLYRPSCFEYIPTMKMIAVAYTDGFVRFFVTASIIKPKFLCQHRLSSAAYSMVYFRDLLICGTRDGAVVSLAIKHNDKIGFHPVVKAQATPHTDLVRKIMPVPIENAIITASLDKSIRLLDLKSLKTIFCFPAAHTRGVRDVAYLPKSNTAASISYDGFIYVWAIGMLRNPPLALIDYIAPHTEALAAICGIDSTNSFVSLDESGVLKFWDALSSTCYQTVCLGLVCPGVDRSKKLHKMFVQYDPPAPFLPLGLTQVYCFSKRRMYVFEYNHSQKTVILRNTADDSSIFYVGYNDREKTYTTFTSNTVRVWDVSNCRIRDTFRCETVQANGGATCAVTHPNGRAYYLGCTSGAIIAKNAATGSTLKICQYSHGSDVMCINFCVGAAPLGDIILSASTDRATIHTSDFNNIFHLPGVENTRCMAYDADSNCIITGDALGVIRVFFTWEVNPTRCDPHAQLQLPKKTLRGISAVGVLAGISAFAACDDDGSIGLYSLRFHPRPFQLLATFLHVSDTPAVVYPVSAMAFCMQSPIRWILYCGDEEGFMTAYNVAEAFQLTTCRTREDQDCVKSEKSLVKVKTFKRDSGILQLTQSLMPNLKINSQRRFSRSKSTVSYESDKDGLIQDFREIGKSVTVVNRWVAHEETITSICVIVPSPSVAADVAAAPLLSHSVLLSCAMDQCCYAWTFAGSRHIGALEQYQRCIIPLTDPAVSDDWYFVENQRGRHLIGAKRDFVKLRVMGLVRRPGMQLFSVIPTRIVARASWAHTFEAINSDTVHKLNFVVEIPESAMPPSELAAALLARKNRPTRTATGQLIKAEAEHEAPVFEVELNTPHISKDEAAPLASHDAVIPVISIPLAHPHVPQKPDRQPPMITSILASGKFVPQPSLESVAREQAANQLGSPLYLRPNTATMPHKRKMQFFGTGVNAADDMESTPSLPFTASPDGFWPPPSVVVPQLSSPPLTAEVPEAMPGASALPAKAHPADDGFLLVEVRAKKKPRAKTAYGPMPSRHSGVPLDGKPARTHKDDSASEQGGELQLLDHHQQQQGLGQVVETLPVEADRTPIPRERQLVSRLLPTPTAYQAPLVLLTEFVPKIMTALSYPHVAKQRVPHYLVFGAPPPSSRTPEPQFQSDVSEHHHDNSRNSSNHSGLRGLRGQIRSVSSQPLVSKLKAISVDADLGIDFTVESSQLPRSAGNASQLVEDGGGSSLKLRRRVVELFGQQRAKQGLTAMPCLPARKLINLKKVKMSDAI